MYKLIILIASTSWMLVACATPSDYVFRDDNRPAYDDAISVQELKEVVANANVTVLDVRLLEDYRANAVLIPGASYVNPDNIEAWASSIPKDAKVVVYCVKGKWVSQKAANYLSEQGIETYTLDGGIEAWQKADYATE